ncbi:MAG: aminopeptidase P family protein [Gemmatimonadetes bacterium]|uniref:Aminopeptidase P family protein n=1 Tax=Candidatus Kutchimonas denitrificans TaxID=3056748 RepID=A0AAE4ZC03_9BACT|nr:aminopeptidase P family protein [Gemmatimonadota bacterium]NIR74725.1 aminopeptidase P family protein [Candidatus Kutchimonas denitrificans]NIS01475.1 aminopeptidase P family protein [Gemmatimonadota bacterium]NIT67216.1 aminopeptidase P family protein [Gemmatimonadota bacterium]NIU52390.1 M24 family metallopeptidase [Gemmatimonadota bacterium]
MKRRHFLIGAGAAGAGLILGTPGRAKALTGERPSPVGPQGIDPLPVATFRARLERARALMSELGFAALFCEPSTNFAYLVGDNFGRSERLIALVMAADGDPVIVAPDFEVDRVERTVDAVPYVRGWGESEDPFAAVAAILSGQEPGRIAVEPTTRYEMARRLQDTLPAWEIDNGAPLFRRLRIIKSEAELKLIRRSISITETSIAATFAALESGLTDRDVAGILRNEMAQRGARGGGLVQFGPTSALPHGGTEGRRLEHGTVVLIDAGCRVHGYASDVTRMHYFGDQPPIQYREVYNTVFAAQSAAYEAGRPGMPCQRLDRIARALIADAGYGQFFTHRLGHGMGMDGHEPPYLVEGNTRELEPGMVFTIEPGIYLPDRWGVRIEDDFVVREDGLEPLSSRVAPI